MGHGDLILASFLHIECDVLIFSLSNSLLFFDE